MKFSLLLLLRWYAVSKPVKWLLTTFAVRVNAEGRASVWDQSHPSTEIAYLAYFICLIPLSYLTFHFILWWEPLSQCYPSNQHFLIWITMPVQHCEELHTTIHCKLFSCDSQQSVIINLVWANRWQSSL